MKYADEVAQISAMQLAKRREYSQNIDSLIEDCDRLRASERKNARRVQDLEKDLLAMRRARDAFKSKFEDSSHEAAALRSKLKALRKSKSLRIGLMITKPSNSVISIAAKLVRTPLAVRSTFAALLGNRKAPPGIEADPFSTDSVAGLPIVKAPPKNTPAEIKSPAVYDDLIEEFSKTPSKGALFKLISHEYYVRGAIALPASRILEHPDILANVSEAEHLLLERILGQQRLLQSGVFLSPRQPNPGYLAERGRVMYCAHSTGHFNSNGYATRTAGLVAGMMERGEDILVVARPGYPWDVKTDIEAPGPHRIEQTISGVPHIFSPGPSWTRDRLDHYLGEAADIVVREALRNRVSVIQAASNYVTALPALMAARRLGIPFVYEVRGLWEITEFSDKPSWEDSDRYRLAVQLESVVAKEADSVLAITSQVKAELIRRGVDATRIELLPNSVDTNKFKPMPAVESLRQDLGLGHDSIVIGYAGSLVAYEGLGDLLEATKILLDEDLDVRLVVVGDGKQLGELKKTATDLGIQDWVIFTGRVPAQAVPDYVGLFDIMPCPRRRLPVTEMVTPLKPLEAMASGKALVLSDLAPLRDLAGDGEERALLCSPGDPSSLASTIARLVRDGGLRVSMGRRARMWTVQERTWASTGQLAADVHRRLENQERSSGGRVLGALKIGIIADQFTLEGLLPEAEFVVLRPGTWQEQLSGQKLDALFVESAWEGIDGLWSHKVGFYGDERFDELKSLIAYCNAGKIPTIFWNKEDPVHFNRFRVTAKYFDHVFTTDAGCIRNYQVNSGGRLKTVGSLPFYAQPNIHNILPTQRKYEHSVAYAGSYYGDKYPKRSAELAGLLTAAKSVGLAIYDRQHLNSESPYKFPAELGRFVKGGLKYAEMVEAYKAHPVHINVNSVDASPTMFSRRVMEIAASGGAIVSGTGTGVRHVMNGLVPVVEDQSNAELLMGEWMNHEEVRLRDAWLAYRLVHRGHTAAHRLAYALRTAGLTVWAPEPPPYVAYIEEPTAEVLAALARQTVQPRHIYCMSGTASTQQNVLEVRDLEHARQHAAAAGVHFLGDLRGRLNDRTAFEDLLSVTTFGTWSTIMFSEEQLDTPGLGLAQLGSSGSETPQLVSVYGDGGGPALSLRRRLVSEPRVEVAPDLSESPRTVLIAGHDLKFAKQLMDDLQGRGHAVLVDKWTDHNKHDESNSLRLLRSADVIFCEWTLGNAVWYSRNKLPHQRLIARLHSQEIFRPYLKSVDYSNVDEIVFVGQHIIDIAVRDHGVPRDKCVVVPNTVDTHGLYQIKSDAAKFNLGMVGIVPAQKHLDRALDVLKKLRSEDTRYRLFVKGKRPEDFPWMAARPDEMRFYDDQYRRIETDPDLAGAVIFDPHGDDMTAWYSKIGAVLSVSDFESFHLTLADGAASGALPVSLAWHGADQIYPVSWLHADTDAMARRILELGKDDGERSRVTDAARAYVADRFASEKNLPVLVGKILRGSGG